MAGSLGSLVVSLGLNAAEFTTGLTKSEYEAKKFAARLDKAITTGAKAAGAAMLGMGAAVSEYASMASIMRPPDSLSVQRDTTNLTTSSV